MKRWQAISAVALSLLILLLLATPALADDFDQIPPELAAIISKFGVLIDGVLGHFVLGNDLTSGGQELVGAVGQVVHNTVHFFAQIVTMF